MRKITPNHIEAYEKGCLKKLFDVIKEDPELSFEIRKDNEAMVYYRKGKVLTIKYTDENNFQIKPLDKQYNNGVPLTEVFDTKKVMNTLKSTSDLRKYFKRAKHLVHKHKLGLEFSVQQNIALGNRSFNGRFIVVDMEWQFSQLYIHEAERIRKTRIDLIIVDTQPNEFNTNDIYLTELKVGTGATEGKSGIIDHIKKTKEIIDKPEVCNILKNEVENIIDIKSRLGLIEGGKKELKLSSKPKMMIILAYRGKEEEKQLKSQANIAIKEAKKIGMEEPLIKNYDLRITLK